MSGESHFSGRTVLVTGAARGIGEAIASRFSFLAAEEAEYITGTVLPVDRGLWM